VICYRVSSHSTGYLRHKEPAEHPHHLFEVFVRYFQGSRHNAFFYLYFLLLMILSSWNAENFFPLRSNKPGDFRD
jgi:hypothetical protein